jgi:hypothetical protein
MRSVTEVMCMCRRMILGVGKASPTTRIHLRSMEEKEEERSRRPGRPRERVHDFGDG